VSIAVSGRSPINGNILSLAAVAITPARELVGVFHRNLMPLRGSERLSHPDVVGYWQSKRCELEKVCCHPVTAQQAFFDLVTFCKTMPKCTLVASPLLSVYGWLTHYWSVLHPTTPMPWGFSGVCARSFAAGLLGVTVQNLSKSQEYVDAHESSGSPCGLPLNDAFICATTFTNLMRRSQKLQPVPLTWLCPTPPELVSVGAPSAGPAPHSQQTNEEVTFPFAEYPSITDPLFEPDFLRLACEVTKAVDWVVTEKVHGSNFSVMCDAKGNVRCAKRTSLLKMEDAPQFFNFDRLQRSLESSVRRCFELVTARHAANAIAVSMVGELAGGEYVHPDVPLDLRGVKVQSGVQYAPDNFYYGFDIAYLTADLRWVFLDFDDAQSIFDEVGVFCSKPLFRGGVESALQFQPIIESTIPERLGLPKIPANFAEGVVARPVQDIFVEGRRVIAKLKHPTFSEFSKTPGDTAPDALLVHFSRNENRLAAVLSKMSSAERADLEFVVQAIVADALSDVSKLHPSFEPQSHHTAQAVLAAKAVVTTKLGGQ
jgi:Rnl2 family RNA ligase